MHMSTQQKLEAKNLKSGEKACKNMQKCAPTFKVVAADRSIKKIIYKQVSFTFTMVGGEIQKEIYSQIRHH